MSIDTPDNNTAQPVPPPYRGTATSVNKPKIRGFLLFMIVFYVGAGCAYTVIYSIMDLFGDANLWFAFGDLAMSLIYVATGILTLIALKKRAGDAVSLGVLFGVFCITNNLITLLLNSTEDLGGVKVVTSMLKSIIWSGIWIIFLFRSRDVKALIPVETRRWKFRDSLMLDLYLLLPIACIAGGILDIRHHYARQEAEQAESLYHAQDQVTDGMIVLTVPEGLTCKVIEQNGIKLLSLTDNKSNMNVTIVSDYDDDKGMEQFDEYWDSWMPEYMDGVVYDQYTPPVETKDSISIYYRLGRLRNDNRDRELVAMFDHTTGKVCVISCHLTVDIDSPVTDLINGIEFL